ncbi:MAG: bifunctional precorrin-2 dehydrogenase/sirohydrochlorin ferrochelatase [Armatimonadota bacterium]|nr:bifunctional precorrin-2 dehydrogenase/sirohydrochlorin ferrochelatase [Armatimonadota bacterium]MCX7776791.1 bifunctional precorrin-2 dehydrogenase/sirohydrochlorin ferrochelatase [Armatimonadota bacterium]MDW8024588.1 bifunctional precorrin-2 dehydrogenase/sirohydrochlorin ferrochelatase [Armatimonadota bacterium]
MFRGLPIILRANEVNAVIVGGGKVALRKAQSLLECGAKVRVICKEPCDGIKQLALDGRIELIEDEYRREHIEGANVVFSCTNDTSINRRVAEDARSLRMLVNVADDINLCTFIMPAILRRGLITISVDTSGASPALAAILRDKIASDITEEYEALAQMLLDMRDELKTAISEPQRRTEALREAIQRGILQLLTDGDMDAAAKLLHQVINDFAQR